MGNIVEKLTSRGWLTSKPGDPYWNEDATDPGAVYEPSRPKVPPPPEGSDNNYEKSKPGERPYWHEGATDPGADYGPKNKTLSMCEPVKPNGEPLDRDDLGDVSDPDSDTYDFAPKALRRQAARFAADAGVYLARGGKRSTPVPPETRPNGCDGDTPWDPQPKYPEGGGSGAPSSASEPYELPGLPPAEEWNIA